MKVTPGRRWLISDLWRKGPKRIYCSHIKAEVNLLPAKESDRAPTCDPCRCDRVTSRPSRPIWSIRCTPEPPFPLETLQTGFSDWSVGSSWRGSHRTVSI